MPRNYIRKKPELAPITEQQISKAKTLIANGKSKRAAASAIGISESCLRKRLKLNTAATSMGRFKPTFNYDQEAEFAMHCKQMDERYFGLTITDLRRLAFEYASANNIENRFDKSAKMAGRDWVECFLKRHPQLVLRQSAATSLARAMGFNKIQVDKFYKNLKDLYLKYNFQPSRIYNVDETGISTVPKKMPKVVTTKGKKVVAKIVSAERGITVTAICCMNASGHYIPPAFIYPRKRPRDDLLDGGPSESICMVSDSGFVNTELFVNWLHHFKYFARPSQEDPVLLILDNHSSHISLEAVKYARSSNIVMLTLPPHGSHKLQPLDRCLYSPLKTKYSIECDKFMSQHPGRGITQYQVARLFNEAYKKVATMGNAESGFRVTGIFPYDDDLFEESDFAPSFVTDQMPQGMEIDESNQEPLTVNQPQTQNVDSGIVGPSRSQRAMAVNQPENDERQALNVDTEVAGPSHMRRPVVVNQPTTNESQTVNADNLIAEHRSVCLHDQVEAVNQPSIVTNNFSSAADQTPDISYHDVREEDTTPSPSIIDAIQKSMTKNSSTENLQDNFVSENDHSPDQVNVQHNEQSNSTTEGPSVVGSSPLSRIENICSTSQIATRQVNTEYVSVEQISPLPRMKNKRRGGRRVSMKSQVITDSPFKQQLEEKKRQEEEKKKRNKKAIPKLALDPPTNKKALVAKDKKKALLTKRRQKPSSSKAKEDEYYCPLCQEKYTYPPTEEWIKCMACEEWWHEQCTSYERGVFVCDNCK